MYGIIKLPKLSKKLEERFWSRVEKTDTCWLWTAGTNGYGYGQFRVGKLMHSVHRLSYYIFTGKQPKNIIMHICDNTRCCNPKHLVDATQAENLADMANKGRSAKLLGITNGHSKLTENDVLNIRKSSDKYADLANFYDVSVSHICNIKTRRTWTHI